MDWLEARNGGYFMKNIRKLAFFWKKNAQKLASFENYTYICNMKNLPAGDIPKNDKNWVVIKATMFKNDKK